MQGHHWTTRGEGHHWNRKKDGARGGRSTAGIARRAHDEARKNGPDGRTRGGRNTSGIAKGMEHEKAATPLEHEGGDAPLDPRGEPLLESNQPSRRKWSRALPCLTSFILSFGGACPSSLPRSGQTLAGATCQSVYWLLQHCPGRIADKPKMASNMAPSTSTWLNTISGTVRHKALWRRLASEPESQNVATGTQSSSDPSLMEGQTESISRVGSAAPERGS